MHKARIGVIGAGWWATTMHIPALLANPAAELVALADLNPERLKAAAGHYGVGNTYLSYQEMIEREALDGVVIVTSHNSHYEITRHCLMKRLHVMLEKPMVLFAPHAQELVALAQQQAVELIIGYPFHFTPHARRAHEIIQSGRLGELHYVNCIFGSEVWKFLQSNVTSLGPVHGPGDVYSKPEISGGGQGHLQVTHAAGLMFFVTGLRPAKVHALMNNLTTNVDVVDAMMLAFEGGALGNVGSYGHADKGARLDVLVYGEAGSLYLEMFSGTMRLHTHDGGQEQLGPTDDVDVLHPGYATANNLVDVILGRTANGSPAEYGWRAVELLDAAYRSARRDGEGIHVADLYQPEVAS